MAKKSAAPSPKFKSGDELPDDVAELFVKHRKYLAAGKANYGRADKLLEQILSRCEPGVATTIPAIGNKPPVELTLIDQFADRNQVWAGSSCKRMKIEEKEIKPQDR